MKLDTVIPRPGINYKTEVIAGTTTFLAMVYILAVNPAILAESGMSKSAVFTATALVSGIASILMGLLARLPLGLAPGMGLNAFFTYTVVLGMGKSWQFALTAVFLEGIIFIILSFLRVRELIFTAIPDPLKKAISAGIGLFIALIGLSNGGWVVSHPQTILTIGNLASPAAITMAIGLLVSLFFLVLHLPGALLLGMISATIASFFTGLSHFALPSNLAAWMPPSLAPIAFKMEWSEVFSLEMLSVLATFLLVDMFDTIGVLTGVGVKAKLLDEQGRLPRAQQALLADALGTTIGALLGTSTVTTYVESASGVQAGGRTGITAVVIGLLFLLSLFLAPLFVMIPLAATAPALVLVGSFMLTPLLDIDLHQPGIGIPVFFTIIMMPLTYSIMNGIAFGLIIYVAAQLLHGKHRKVTPLAVLLALVLLAALVWGAVK